MLIHFPDIPGHGAEEADDFLTRRGLILRLSSAYRLPNALRMTVGTEEANRLVVAALSEFMGPQVMGSSVSAPTLQPPGPDRNGLDRLLDRPRRPRARRRLDRFCRNGPLAQGTPPHPPSLALPIRLSRQMRRRSRAPIWSSSAYQLAPAAPLQQTLRRNWRQAPPFHVGSVKGAVLCDMSPHIPEGVHFVPAHPGCRDRAIPDLIQGLRSLLLVAGAF